MKKVINIFIFVFLGFCFGFFFSFKKASEEFLYWDSQFKAASLVWEIKLLKKDFGTLNVKSSDTLETKEIALNGELMKYGLYLESKYSWIFPYITSIDPNPKYIAAAIKYRLENPYSVYKWSSEIVDSNDVVRQNNLKKQQMLIDNVLKLEKQ